MINVKHDAEAMRRHFEWVLTAGTAGCVQLELRKSGKTERSFHVGAESLVAEVLRRPDHAANVGVNPRPATWAGDGFRECGADSIETVTAIRIDIDACRPMALATAGLIRGELDADARRRAEAGSTVLELPPVAIDIAARCAEVPGLLAGVEEHKAALRRAVKDACSAASIELRGDLLDKLVTCANRAAAGQPTSDAEHAQAVEAGRALATWGARQGWGEPLIVSSGNGCHIWFPIAPIKLDGESREAVHLACSELERLCRLEVERDGWPLRVDAWGGFAATTRLAGCPNRKGTATDERPHRLSTIVQGAERADGGALAAWLVSEGGRISLQRQEERAKAEAEHAARRAANPGFDGGALRNLDRRVDAAVERFVEQHPLSGCGHDETLGNLLRLARMLVWELDLSDADSRLRTLVHTHCDTDHWTPRQREAEVRKALRLAESPAGARGARGALLTRWAEEDARKAEERRQKATPKQRAGALDDDFGPSPDAYFEGNAAVDTAGDDRDEGSGVHAAPGNVKQGPWKGSSAGESRWRLPEEQTTGVIRSPTVSVPEPESWLSLVADDPGCPEVLPANTGELKDCTSFAIAARLLRQIDQFCKAFVFDGGRFWLYQDGVYRRLPAWWIKRSFQLYHGAQSIQQKVGASPGTPWFSTATNIASSAANLQTLLEARQATSDDRSFFGDSPALAVFGTQTLVWDTKTRGIRLAPNSPDHRATFAYPFEFTLDDAEPKHLLRVMREDMFAGVEPAEAERRILRIRQQLGLAMLGAQRLTNLHSVLIMLGQGHDGKSTLLGILQACMPPGSWRTMHPQDLSSGIGDGAEARADLHGVYSIMCDDVSARSMRDSSAYKTATAYGSLRGRHFGSGVNSFQVDVRATWLLACQELWDTPDKTRGFQRRHCIVEFPNSIPDGEADKALRAKLLAHEQREIVLWCVRAVFDLLAGDELAQPECSARLMRAWMLGNDDVASFLEANTESCSGEPEGSWPKTEDVWRAYMQWSEWVTGAGKGKPSPLNQFSSKARRAKGVQVVTTGHTKTSRISRRVRGPQ